MEYPFEIYWPEDGSEDAPGAIRLSVAALVACLDTGLIDGVQISDSETAPYFRSEKFARTDPLFGTQEWDVWRVSHTFIHIKPQGALKIAAAKVTSALAESIRLGQLQTITLKTDVNGSVNFDDTWIRTKVFIKWCRERGLNLDDNFDQYVRTENDIFSAALV
jgi:hypothetical protein